jgi:hypothetical protein
MHCHYRKNLQPALEDTMSHIQKLSERKQQQIMELITMVENSKSTFSRLWFAAPVMFTSRGCESLTFQAVVRSFQLSLKIIFPSTYFH